MKRLNLPFILALLAITAGVAAVFAGLALNGSPATRRAHALDARRIQDLRDISNGLNMPFINRGMVPSEPAAPAPSLPASLTELPGRQDIYLQERQLRDPDTGAPYRYQKTGDSTYELCATFARASTDDAANRSRVHIGTDDTTFWRHPAGEKCFSFDATKSVY